MTKIYHNPRCSKSRQTLQLLQDNNIDAEIIAYLETPPSEAEISAILDKLGMTARDIIRSGEEAYKEQNISNPELSESQLISAIHNYPKLLQRPIVVHGDKAAIGRPPESVLELFK